MTKHVLPEGPFTLDEATSIGTGKHALTRMQRDGVVTRVLPGLYWRTVDLEGTTSRQRHLTIAEKVLGSFDGASVLARESAAIVHGLATPRRLPNGPKTISLYASNHRNSRNAAGVQVTVTPLHVGDVVQVDGIPVTSLSRTAIDLARGMTIPYALIALDSALRLGAPREVLMQTALAMKGWSGTKLLRSVIPLADGLAESALESAARGSCLAAGLPAPQLQRPIAGASGKQYRVDMLWEQASLIVEPDGWGKYGELPQQQEDALRREKHREDDLREADFTVLRVTWDGLGALPQRVARHLSRRQRHR